MSSWRILSSTMIKMMMGVPMRKTGGGQEVAARGMSTMRAAVVSSLASKTGASDWALKVERLQQPKKPRVGEVLLEVQACGVCHTDLHVLQNDIGFPVPSVLGHEVVGKVVAIGENVPESLKGMRVAAAFIMPCLDCHECDSGREEMCVNFFKENRAKGCLYDGDTRLMRTDGQDVAQYSMGGLAELCVTPASSVAPIPESVLRTKDDAAINELAIVGCAMFTAYGAVHNTAKLKHGESACVIGVGGIGSGAVQLLRAAGASKIIAVDVSTEKLDRAVALGATACVDASGKEPHEVAAEVIKLSGGDGVDAAFEALGRSNTVEAAIAAVKPGGRCALIGLAHAAEFGRFAITPLVRRQVAILGSYGARASTDLKAILSLIEKGQIDVGANISRRFDLDGADTAYRQLQRGEIVGRAIVEM